MWSPDRRLFVLAALAAAGCGFTPLHAPDGIATRLDGAVLVDAPADPNAFDLVARLEERLGRGGAARYALAVEADLRQDRLAVTSDGAITRFNLIGNARYRLTDLATGDVAAAGSVNAFTGYSATGSPVATLTAERDARARLMVLLADAIVARLFAAAPA